MKRKNRAVHPESVSIHIEDRPRFLSYAAGLIDGEGCVGIYYNKITENHQLRITVEMGNKAGLKVLQGLFGGKWYHKDNLAPRREVWSWMLFGSEAEKALLELKPFLLVKRKQAIAALECNWSAFKGKQLTIKEREYRNAASKQVKELNKRGFDVV